MGLGTGTIGPIFEHVADVTHANVVSDSVGDDNGTVYTTDTSGNCYTWNLTTLQQVGATLAPFASGNTSIAYVTSAILNGPSGVFGNATNQNLVVIEFRTGYKQTYTIASQLPSFNTAKGSLMASDPQSNIVVASSNTAGHVIVLNGFVVSNFTPAALAGAKVSSVIFKSDTRTFLLGTNTGLVLEMTASGTILQTITLPTTPNAGTPPVHIVTGMSYYNGYLLALSALGVGYHYNYTNSSILGRIPFCGDGVGGSNAICTNICGFTFISNAAIGNSSSYGLMAVDINATGIISYDIVMIDASGATTAVFIGLDVSLKRGWILSRDSKKFRIFDFKNIIEFTTDTTRNQDPIGVDISSQIIRFLTRRPGTTKVDFNQIVASGQQTIGCRKFSEYIEVTIELSPRKVDVRMTST